MSEASKNRKYKILLVDDEEIVRNGIENTIEWTDLGFDFSGSYTNGTDAAQAVDKIRPAVVITDICMPFGDGLDLAELITSKHAGTKVILLTGFDEFEYAQRAVKLGAYDYILKPITADELRALLGRLHDELDSEARRAERLRDVSRQLVATRESRIRELTAKLPARRTSETAPADEELVRVLQSAGLLREGPGVAVVADLGDSTSLLERELSGSFFVDSHERTVMIVSADSTARAAARALKVAEAILSQNPVAKRATVGIGEPYSSAGGFASSYSDAVCAFGYRFILGCGRSIAHSDVPDRACRRKSQDAPPGGEWTSGFQSAVAALADSLRYCDRRETRTALRTLFREMRQGFVSRSRFDLELHSVLVRLNEVRRNRDMEPISIDPFATLSTIDDVERFLVRTCTSTIDAAERKRVTYAGTKTEEAIDFIKNNYAIQSLSLRLVCSSIGVSPSYFSSIFKNHTGRTFVEYLTEVRVEHAKQLLKTTDLKSYEIAERVGYTDPHYFSTIFKKSTNRSPIEFRREVAAGETSVHA